MQATREIDIGRRRMRIGVASFFLSIAGLAGIAMLIVLSVL